MKGQVGPVHGLQEGNKTLVSRIASSLVKYQTPSLEYKED